MSRFFEGEGEPVYELFWDIHTYFSKSNFNGEKEDVFTDHLLSMNLLCIPKKKRPDLIEHMTSKNMVRVDHESGKFRLDEYVMSYKGENVKISQLGDEEKCIR